MTVTKFAAVVSAVFALTLSGCSSAGTAEAEPSPSEAAAPVESTAGAELFGAGIPELVAAWDPASGELGSLTIITIQLPAKVDAECIPNIEPFQAEALKKYEQEGVDGIAQVNGESGGAKSIDFLRYWQSYVDLAGSLCM